MKIFTFERIMAVTCLATCLTAIGVWLALWIQSIEYDPNYEEFDELPCEIEGYDEWIDESNTIEWRSAQDLLESTNILIGTRGDGALFWKENHE